MLLLSVSELAWEMRREVKGGTFCIFSSSCPADSLWNGVLSSFDEVGSFLFFPL